MEIVEFGIVFVLIFNEFNFMPLVVEVQSEALKDTLMYESGLLHPSLV